LRQRAADPAGGLGEALADLARLALQQPDLARRLDLLRRDDAAAVAVLGVDAPLGAVFVQLVVTAAMGQELADVEADAAGADDRHAAPRRPAAEDDVDVARDLG